MATEAQGDAATDAEVDQLPKGDIFREPDAVPRAKVKLSELIGDPFQFIPRLTIMHKSRQRLSPLDMNIAQQQLLEDLQGHNRIIVLKARQLGVSTLLRAWHFWKAYTAVEPRQYAVISHTRASAQELHRIDKTFYNNLPTRLRKPLEAAGVRTLRFADSKAEVSTYTAGGKGGMRSYAMNSVHLSEFAFYDNQEETMATVTAAVGEGQIVIESTPNVYGDMFHRLVTEAQAGENEWKLVFFPWYLHPSYRQDVSGKFHYTHKERAIRKSLGINKQQFAWRRKQIRTLGETKFRREYPASVTECFTADACFFLDHAKLAQMQVLNLGKHEHREYTDVDINDRYVIGVDVGAGLGGNGNYSAATVVSCSTRQPVYHYVTNKLSPALFADQLVELYRRFHRPKMIVEANNHGILVLHRLRELKVKNLYTENGKDFMTTNKTRPLLFSALREALETGIVQVIDKEVLKELKQLIYKNEKPQAPKGKKDDLTISMALCYYVLTRIPLEVHHSLRQAMMERYLAKAKAKTATRALPWSVRGGDGRGFY